MNQWPDYMEVSVFCRIGKHAGEFEHKFLSDLQGGKLPDGGSYCGLEGELEL